MPALPVILCDNVDPELARLFTYAVVAICVFEVPATAVGAVGNPVKDGLAFGANTLTIPSIAN